MGGVGVGSEGWEGWGWGVKGGRDRREGRRMKR